MHDGETSEMRPDLELEVGTGVDVELRHLGAATGTFSGLINEVARDYTGVEQAVKWIVEVKAGSVKLPLRAEVSGDRVSPSAAYEISALVVGGLALLDREAERPPHFSDKALEQVKALANLLKEDFPLAVRNGGERVTLSRTLHANATKLLGPLRRSYGTVEGQLQEITIHGKQEFGIWPLGRPKVTCGFGEFVTLDEVRPAVGKRVAARGWITARPNGERRSITVESFRILGGESVRAADVLGIFRGYETVDP